MPLILGIANGNHDASACVFDDYRLVAAVPQERVTRVKAEGRTFPDAAINEALAIAGVSRYEVDAIAMLEGALPLRFYRRAYPFGLAGIRHWRRDRSRAGIMGPQPHVYAIRRRLGAEKPEDVVDVARFLAEGGFHPNAAVHFSPHHFSHAIQPLFHRPDWDNALLYTVDGGGDGLLASACHFADGKLETVFGGQAAVPPRDNPPISVATIYGLCTEAVGFKRNRHEGKLTGLAAMGEAKAKDAIKAAFQVTDNGEVLSDLRSSRDGRRFLRQALAGLEQADVAASVQRATEEIVTEAARRMQAATGARALGISGGLFANVLLNQKLLDDAGFDEIFVYPAMSDQGLSVGAAQHYLLARDGLDAWLDQRWSIDTLYLGRDYDSLVDRAFDAAGLIREPGDPAEAAAQAIDAGDAVAIYKGRMEFGPRALGARSVLADPRSRTINDSLNARMERSEFMPFAPYIAEADADKVFDLPAGARETARFMTITCAVRPEWRERLPAVTHVDGTARPQLIRRDENPLYFDILKAFEARTGIPVLINTSFNVHEEPIINTPDECIRALKADRVDAVVTDNALWRTKQKAD